MARVWQTAGHDKAVGALARSLDGGRLAHSYIFIGPSRVGKTTLALDFARAANCLADETARPCGDCRQCARVTAGLHPDVRVIGLETARSGRLRSLISIDQAREVQREAGLLPYEGRYRVFIFESAEKLSGEAANALLKTLEEPPESVIIALLATHADSVLPTILSRCRRVDLRPVAAGAIADFLTARKGVDADSAREIAGMARGRVGWAVGAVEDPSAIDRVSETLDAIEAAIADSLSGRFEYAERLAGRFSGDREGVFGELDLWLGWWRDAMLTGQGKPELVSNVSRRETLDAAAARFSPETTAAAIRTIMRTAHLLERNVSPRLAAESMMLGLPG